MSKPKVVMYARFGVHVEQETVDQIKKEMDGFLEMIGAHLMEQHWEVLPYKSESSKLDYIIDKCMRMNWSVITHDLGTLHHDTSRAISIIEEAASDQVPIFFIDAESAVKSIFGI